MNPACLQIFSIKISNHNKIPHLFRLTIHPFVVWPTGDTHRYFGKKNIKRAISEVSAGIPPRPTPSVQYSTLYFTCNFIPLLPHTVISRSSFSLYGRRIKLYAIPMCSSLVTLCLRSFRIQGTFSIQSW